MKFNLFKRSKPATKNFEGAIAYSLTPQSELYAAVVTASLSNKFYETADQRVERIRSLIAKNDPAFVAKLAAYTRNKMYMRSIPLVLAVELARTSTGNSVVSTTVKNVVKRADEITELLAYYQLANERKGPKKLNRLSKQVQKGLSEAFNSFDEYQFGKYKREGADISLRDALFVVHPKAKTDEQQSLFNKIARKQLATPYTWETELSAIGNNNYASATLRSKAVTQKWEELIASGRLGYMALMRNLRNIMQANVSSKHMQMVCSTIADKKAVANAKQLPFRFLAAYREVNAMSSSYVPMVMTALERATEASIANFKGFDADTRVLIACDVSGSMQQRISPKSSVLYYDIGLMLGMLLRAKCDHAVTGLFGSKWKTVNFPQHNVLSNVQQMYQREGEVGYSTNGHLVIDHLIRRREVMDKVMIFTDCQMWDNSGNRTLQDAWDRYKTIAPQARLYLFDLAGYGNTPIRITGNDVYLIAGWSDKVFDVLSALENGRSAMAEIDAMELV